MEKNTIYINGRFLTQTLTGVQRTAYELVTALDEVLEEQESKPTTFTLIYSGELVNAITLKHIKLINKGSLRGNLWEQFELPFYTRGSLLVSLCTISTLFKRNQLVMIHDASVFVNPQFFPLLIKTWYKIALPVLAKRIKHLLTVSEFSKNELSRTLGIPKNKITVIYNASDHIERFEEPSEQFKAKVNILTPYILAVSSLSENKNFKIIDLAMQKMKFDNYNVLIAGGKMNTLRVTSAAKNAHYLGYVTDSELKYLYQRATVFIFASFYEGFGIPPLEAMQMGCPVISSNTSAMPEILGKSCLYFDPFDVESLIGQLQILLNDPALYQSFKIIGKQQANSYQWKNSAMQLHQMICSTLST